MSVFNLDSIAIVNDNVFYLTTSLIIHCSWNDVCLNQVPHLALYM